MEIYKQAIVYFGEKRQLLLAAEEYSELIVQLIKAKNGRLKLSDLREELADAIIMTEQLALINPSILESSFIWGKVSKSTFQGIANSLIEYMTIVINEIMNGLITARSQDAILQIAAILARFVNYLDKSEIDSIIAFKQRRLKEIIDNDKYSNEVRIW